MPITQFLARAVGALLVTTAMGALPAAAASFGMPTSEYSATMVFTSEGETQRMDHSYAGNLQRFDMSTPRGKAAMIVDVKASQTTMLMAAQKIALVIDGQTKMADAMPYGTLNDAAADVAITKEGAEEINGVATTRYKVVHTKDGEGRFDGHMWVTPENIIVRYKGKSTKDGKTVNMEMLLENLKLGAQDRAKYKVPGGFRTMRANAAMMKGMKGMPGLPK